MWLEFLQRIGHFDDPYLEELEPPDRLRICGAFLHARRRGDLGGARSAQQVSLSTAKTTLHHVAATFVSNHKENPIADSRGKPHEHIRRQIAAYKQKDPPVKHQKALPPIVFCFAINRAHRRVPRGLCRTFALPSKRVTSLQGAGVNVMTAYQVEP